MAKHDRGKWNVPPAGEIFPLHLDSLSHQGSTIARKEGQVVFAAFGIPGEDADVLIERVHKDYLEGRVVNVHTPSPHRVTPRCEYFGECGGCQLQHIDYDYQLELKRSVVVEQLRRIGKLDDIDVRPTLPSPDPWHYRNHARFTVDREGYLGFTMRGRKRIVRTMTCYIIHPWIRDTMQQLQGSCRGMRQVAMRVGFHTGDTLIQPPLPPTPSPAAAGEGELDARALTGDEDPNTLTLDNDSEDRAPVEESEDLSRLDLPLSRRGGGGGWGEGVVSGQKTFEEALLGERFRVSAASFFQVNTEQAENLIRLVRDGLGLSSDDVLLDAYAGVGTFAKTLASRVKQVIAIEVSASSVADGKFNTLGIENVDWLLGEVEALLPDLRERPTAVVLDPSRQGCGVPALDALIDARVPRIAYVSCEPATLARDLRILVDGGYTIDFVQPVDMFPQTYHIESVAILRAGRGGMRGGMRDEGMERVEQQGVSAEQPESAAPARSSPRAHSSSSLIPHPSSLPSSPRPSLVLASGSPRRRELLAALGVPFEVRAADVPEPLLAGIPAAVQAETLARAKAYAVAADAPDVALLGADTIVVLDGVPLGKPADADEARQMLASLRGRAHEVVTGVAVVAPGGALVVTAHTVTRAFMRAYTDAESEAYIATGDPFDKAGGYAIQHDSFRPVELIDGCYCNVMGLPLWTVRRLLTDAAPGLRTSLPGERMGRCAECPECPEAGATPTSRPPMPAG